MELAQAGLQCLLFGVARDGVRVVRSPSGALRVYTSSVAAIQFTRQIRHTRVFAYLTGRTASKPLDWTDMADEFAQRILKKKPELLGAASSLLGRAGNGKP